MWAWQRSAEPEHVWQEGTLGQTRKRLSVSVQRFVSAARDGLTGQVRYDRVSPMSPTASPVRNKKTSFQNLGKVRDLTGGGSVGFADSDSFNFSMAFIVTVNCITIGLETELNYGSWVSTFSLANLAFLLLYFAELLLRLLTMGSAALRDGLTLLDCVLLVIAFLERSIGSGFMKPLPMFRLLRLFRLFGKLEFFRESQTLKTLVFIGWTASRTVAWVCMVLMVMILAIAVCIQVVVGGSFVWTGSMDPAADINDLQIFDRDEYFGSFSRSVLTLWQVVTLSQWSSNVARKVLEAYPMLLVFFIFFISVTSYGIVMFCVSNITQESICATKAREDEAHRRQRVEAERLCDLAVEAFKTIHIGDDGLTPEDIEVVLASTELPAILEALQVPSFNGEGIIRLFDRTGRGKIRVDDLLFGMLTMGEDLMPRDFARLSIWVDGLLMRVNSLGTRVEKLAAKVLALRHSLENAFEAVQFFQETRDIGELKAKAVRTVMQQGSSGHQDVPTLVGAMQPEPEEDPIAKAARLKRAHSFFTGLFEGLPVLSEVREASPTSRPPPAPKLIPPWERPEELDVADSWHCSRSAEQPLPGTPPNMVVLRQLLSGN